MEPFEDALEEWHRLHLRVAMEELLAETRVIGSRLEIDTLSDQRLFEFTRLDRPAFLHLYGELRADIELPTKKGHAVPGMTKLLGCLQFLANGSFQRLGASSVGMSQSSLCRSLAVCLRALCRLSKRYIKMPATQAEWNEVKLGFYHLAHFPNVMGAIDCTHIELVPPAADEYKYRNRKLGHSFNVQMIAQADMRFLNVFAGFPGSAHDAHIFRASAVYGQFLSGQISGGWLLGDAGYPCLPWLMTPLARPASAGDQAYNLAHQKTRAVVERAFGLLKVRFRCLDRTGGALQYSPRKVVDIIVACVVLHNFAILQRVGRYGLEEVTVPDDMPTPPYSGSVNQQGQQTRRALIANHF